MKQKKLSWLIGGLFTLPVLSAVAQQAPATTEQVVQQVTMVGVRDSMNSATATKEASNNIIEVVSSEDIGKLPDTTIAESLARLPGLQSGVDRGNASQIVARGLGPRFIAATLDGRELASPEPNRAVRFEQFPSESLTGAAVYKTQSAELIEGGVATTIDLHTVSPLNFKERQFTFKGDALYAPLGNGIDGAKNTGPRLGTLYVDQFNNHTLGVAFAASYQKQPSLEVMKESWGFNTGSSAGAVNGSNGQVVQTPWGFQDSVKRGTDTRSSALAKVEWKPNPDAIITADAYYEKQAILEPEISHYYQGAIGNWNGGNAASYSNPTIVNGVVTGATVSGITLDNNDNLWTQDSHTFATGLNGKFKSGEWKFEGDLSKSSASRDSSWESLQQQLSTNPTFSWSNGVQNYSLNGAVTGNPALFNAPWNMNINTIGHVKDEMTSLHLNAIRSVENLGDVKQIKFGLRATDREKSYNQLTYTVNPLQAIPTSAYSTVHVNGLPDFIALNDFNGAAVTAFGPNVFNPAGRTPTLSDQEAGWNVKERSESLYSQADLDGMMFGKDYRGNVGLRFVRTTHTSSGVQSINGAPATPISVDGSDTEVLPSANLIFTLDPQQEHQLRFSVARAMARAPLDELRASQALWFPSPGSQQPVTGSAGNPNLKPMLANQVDLAYQWYFGKGSLLSAGVFFKKMQSYVKIAQNQGTINGQNALISQSVNGTGGEVRGVELVYQQAFTNLPAPFNRLGIFSNYAYTTSNITESNGGAPFPVDGLMKTNAGLTLWYEHNGFEARLAATYHSAFTRDPSWTAGQFIINGAETNLSFNLSQQITKNVQIHFGADNLTNQKLVYTDPNNAYIQQIREFGRRYNLGFSYRM